MPTPPPKPVTLLAVRLPTPLHRRLRVYAAKRGIPLQHLITQAVRDLLAKE
jgi:predicted HicB family RNase H-like nuclease